MAAWITLAGRLGLLSRHKNAAGSPGQLESELQPVFSGRGFQSVPLLPWRFQPVYFALSWLFAVGLIIPILLEMSREELKQRKT
ncbi:MAG: hypothetical protein AB9891_09225 [Anaerolineaceae bacterium]